MKTANGLLGPLHFRWWVPLLLGIACIVLGIALTAKPFESLRLLVLFVGLSFILTGAAEFLLAALSPSPGLSRTIGALWAATGVAALVWPGITIEALALLTGLSLTLGGILKLAASITGTIDDRLIAILGGLAGLIFGVLALAWPDVTVLVIALLVGPRTILFGFGQVGLALANGPWRDAAEHTATPKPKRRMPYLLRLGGAALALVAALGLLAVSAWLNDNTPTVSAFYDTPDDVPAKPGALLSSEPFDHAIPEGAIGWLILYATLDHEDKPAVASALVVAPATNDGPHPLLAWTHGTTGVDRHCAPSVAKKPFESGALFTVDRIVANGWVLVATDYIGLGTEGPHPYLIGEGEARSTLDAVRAARQMPELDLAPDTVVWGHSQGGHAALWTGILAPSYAPDANVRAVAALAPASDLPALVDNLGVSPIAAIMFSYITQGYTDIYDDVTFNDYVGSNARAFVRRTAERCLTEPAALVSIVGSLPFTGALFQTSPTTGPFGQRLQENVPDQPIEVPLLVAQGLSDSLVLPHVQTAFVQQRCSQGQSLQYWTFEGLDHVPLVEAQSPLIDPLIDWTKGVLAGAPQSPGCETVAR